MRARLGLQSSQQLCELREIVLRDKPSEMLEASPKGTVPVLILPNGDVLEESLDIMLWALNQNDPENWLSPEIGTLDEMLNLINRCENEFKGHLDRYKYAPRYEEVDPITHRTQAENFLDELDKLLTKNSFLFGSQRSLADMAIAPFIRQFANVDRTWFDQTDYAYLKSWLNEFLGSSRFKTILKKYPVWTTGDPVTYFPEDLSI
ncbi:glutathione S-transferase [Kiloniella spongiae]|uniref:Glutathione S-transferase n=2 Tax=Kiloniella spongiae TaxID=1489064 RepID=A0A0H2MI54_9PROT|nr:glutathione S-transferase [Kiloniella spongiae]